MNLLSRTAFHLKSLFRRGKLDEQLAEEVRAHVEMATEANLAKGLSRDEARHAALREFGNVAGIQEQARDERGWVWLDQLAQDLRYGVRMLGKSPGVTITAVLTLALGIGVNAALFTIYDIIVLRPLPSRDPDELVEIRARNEQVKGGIDSRVSYLDYLDYCGGSQAFSDLVAIRPSLGRLPDGLDSEAGSPLERTSGVVEIHAVSGNYFSALGGEIALGRDFLPEEAGAHAGRPVIVLSHLFWQTYFHGDPGVIGRTLTTRDAGSGSRIFSTIIGVAAPEFIGHRALPPTGWIPLTANPKALGQRGWPFVSLLGRLRPGVAPGQAKAELDGIAQRLARDYPQERRATSVGLVPGMRLVDFSLNPKFALLFSPLLLGFALVLVIACLNVANLLLARGIARQHEIGVRLVLGAGRGRLVRQLFVENFLLCLLGAGAALVLAMWTLQALRPLAMSLLAGEPAIRSAIALVEIGLDRRIVGFGALLAGVAGLAAGLLPALQSVRPDGMPALKHEGTAFGRRMTPLRLRNLLLVGQVAVCLSLLAVSGIMTAKLLKSQTVDPGFATDRVYQVVPPALVFAADPAWGDDAVNSVETLGTVPGVSSACLIAATPLRKPGGNLGSILGKVAGGYPDKIDFNRVSAGFFETFGVPLLRGRGFTRAEVATGAQVLVVSESAARRLWPGREAVGQFLSLDARLDARSGDIAPGTAYREWEVVGVAGDILSNWGADDIQDDQGESASGRLLWLPIPARGARANIFVRVQADSVASLRGIEHESAAAGVPVQFFERLATIVDRGLSAFRVGAGLSGALSGLALLLATVGLYGVIAFGVNQREREIGVRMALGATVERVTGLFVRQGMRLVTWGLMFGLAGGAGFAVLLGKAVPGARFVSDVGFCVEVFAVVTTFLIVVAFIACWLPARRAAKVDPMIALRAE